MCTCHVPKRISCAKLCTCVAQCRSSSIPWDSLIVAFTYSCWCTDTQFLSKDCMYFHTKLSTDSQKLVPISRTVNVVPDFLLHANHTVSELNGHSTLFITMHVIWWQRWSSFGLLNITANVDQSCCSVKNDYKSTNFIVSPCIFQFNNG